jgi:hypothetical protein
VEGRGREHVEKEELYPGLCVSVDDWLSGCLLAMYDVEVYVVGYGRQHG